MIAESIQPGQTVWMIIPSFYPAIGGAERQVQRLSKALMIQGRSVHVLTRQHGPALPRDLPANDCVDDIPITRIYSRGIAKIDALFYMLGGLWHLLRYGRQDIYHVHALGSSAWMAIVARYLLGGRCIIKLRTDRSAYEKLCASRLTRWLFFTLLHLADCIIVVNSQVEKFVLELGILASRVVLLPNSVEISQFYPASEAAKEAARKRLGLPVDKTIVLYVGRLEPIKGLDVLLRAWALLPKPVHTTALLLIVGDGREHEKLLEMADSLGVCRSVLLTGAKQVVHDYYWAADIFVLPSLAEGLSNALVEAMACGLPAIASNVGGAMDVIEEGKTGFLFESGNQEQLAQKLATLVGATNQWAEMGMQARRTVLTYADLDVVANRLNELYCQLFQQL